MSYGHFAELPSGANNPPKDTQLWDEDEDEDLAVALQESKQQEDIQAPKKPNESGTEEEEEQLLEPAEPQNSRNNPLWKRFFDRSKETVSKLKKQFEDPWKGWVELEQLHPQSQDDTFLAEYA